MKISNLKFGSRKGGLGEGIKISTLEISIKFPTLPQTLCILGKAFNYSALVLHL